MQAPNPVVVRPPEGNPAEIPRRQYTQYTPQQERTILAAKRAYEEAEKSNQNALFGARIVTFAAATLSFAAIKAVESNLATVALLIVGISSAVFFLFSFTSYMSLTVNIPIHMNVLIKVYDLKKLNGEFSELTKRAEGSDLNPDDELVCSIRVKMNSITKKMDELENILMGIRNVPIPNIEQDQNLEQDLINNYHNVSNIFTRVKTLLGFINEVLKHNPPPQHRESFINQMKELSESMNELLNPINEISLLTL